MIIIAICALIQTGVSPFSHLESWETLARPWMTGVESTLFDALTEEERVRFRGTFVARRQEHPEVWSDQGLYLPIFFCDRTYDDIRDYLLATVGEPDRVVKNATNPSVPSEWHYPDYEFHFVAVARTRITLTERSVQEWERVKQRMILHPQMLYSFSSKSFGRTRLPEDITWFDTNVVSYLLDPDPRGEHLRVVVALPASFIEAVKARGADSEVALELLIELDKGTGETEFRHDSSVVQVTDDRVAVFEAHLPPGHFNAKLMIYSGFLPVGLQAQTSIYVAPPELPRIGTPIIVQQWAPEGLIQPGKNELMLGGFRYRWDQAYDNKKMAMVLVHAQALPAEVFILKGDASPQPLTFLNRVGTWFLFELPPQTGPFQLIAQTIADGNGLRGFRTFPPQWPTHRQSTALSLKTETKNYLELEELQLGETSALSYLFIAGQPYLATDSQTIPWLPFNWGEQAELRVGAMKDSSWQEATAILNRSEVYTELDVRNEHLVLGSRNAEGDVQAVPTILRDGVPLQGALQTPIAKIDQVWGLVFKDDVLDRSLWPFAREELIRWLESHLKPTDLVYVVLISQRPQLVLPPTLSRADLVATLNSLTPSLQRDTSFDLQYLIDEITHLEYHTKKPHQVVMMTPQLTDDLTQLESLLLELRRTGLQVYNLEFPDPLRVADSRKSLKDRAIPMETMKPDTESIRDNFQETRNTKVGFRISLAEKKLNQARRDQLTKEAAARSAFSDQIQLRTAGLCMRAEPGQERQTLSEFFRHLTLWFDALTHVQLPVNTDPESLTFQVEPGTQVYWTSVQWTAK